MSKESRPQHYRYLLNKDKDIIGPYLDKDLNKIINHNYVSDNFTKIHNDNTHVLFAGCSITVGCGVNDIKKSWSYKVYDEINKIKPCSGYFNVALSGASPVEIMINVLKYISRYGIPDYIFMLFSNYGRDWNKFNTLNGRDGSAVEVFVFNLYSIIDEMCKSNGSKLFTTCWSDLVGGVTDYISLGETTEPYKFEVHMNNIMNESFDSYYLVNKQKFKENTFS